jgi:predicted nucleotidyltransferase
MTHSGYVPPSRRTNSAAPSAASAKEALRFAEMLARSCSQALGETVAGVILHGSLTLDDYLPGRSDVDLLVVVQDPLTDAQLAALTDALAGHRPQAPGPVDLRLVTWQVAA